MQVSTAQALRVASTMLLTAAVAACSASGGGAPGVTPTPEPTERPTPEPTPTAWTLTVAKATYTTEAFVGDTIAIDVTIKNSGKVRSPVTRLNFSELDKHADFHRCKPKCTKEDLPMLGPSAVFGGVKPGASTKFHVEFVATKVGVVDWTICLYDDEEYSDEVWCGDGTTAIR